MRTRSSSAYCQDQICRAELVNGGQTRTIRGKKRNSPPRWRSSWRRSLRWAYGYCSRLCEPDRKGRCLSSSKGPQASRHHCRNTRDEFGWAKGIRGCRVGMPTPFGSKTTSVVARSTSPATSIISPDQIIAYVSTSNSLDSSQLPKNSPQARSCRTRLRASEAPVVGDPSALVRFSLFREQTSERVKPQWRQGTRRFGRPDHC